MSISKPLKAGDVQKVHRRAVENDGAEAGELLSVVSLLFGGSRLCRTIVLEMIHNLGTVLLARLVYVL
jgi:hypothetical protein